MEGGWRDESWERYMEMERAQLQGRASGSMARTLAYRSRARPKRSWRGSPRRTSAWLEKGLVRLMRESGEVYYEHVEALTRALRPDRIRAEQAPQVA